MKTITAGLSHREDFYPRPQDLASAMGNHGADVVATTALILYFEAASNNLALPYYDDGEISVGTHVNVDHLAPARASMPVSVFAVLEKQQGRRLEFDLTARQGDTVVMTGKHYRAVMRRDQFSDVEETEQQTRKQIDFWFDFHSPWCYFASYRIGEIAQQANAVLKWRPVHLANLMDAVDGRRPLESNPNFVAWYQQDLKDTAIMAGLPYAPHTEYPKRPSRVLRAAVYAAEQGLAEPFVQQIMRGYWSQQKDISDAQWVAQVAESVGLDSTAVLASMTAPEYRQQLTANLEEAVTTRLFGLPASVVDGRIFWGNDRLPLLRHYLSAKGPDLD